MQRLSGADASFVYGETPGSHLHLGTLAVLDPSTAPDGFNVERLRSLIEARAGLLGPFMRRLVEVPFGLDRPAWVDDPRLDLERRIRPVGVPAPGGPRELGALVGDLLAHKVDPRPSPVGGLVHRRSRGRSRGSADEDASLPGGRSPGCTHL